MTEIPPIEDLLPHDGTMVLIDRVIEHTGDRIACATTSHRRGDNPLRFNGRLSAVAGVEYAGQAIAIHTGLASNAPIAGGVLASLRNLAWSQDDLTQVAGDLVIRARRIAAAGGGARYDFEIGDGDIALVTGSATVAFFGKREGT